MMKIEELRKKLKDLTREMTIFQEKCNHKHQQIKFDEKNNARWHCTVCDKMVRIPSPQELEDWIKK